jgi:hypothetical protein
MSKAADPAAVLAPVGSQMGVQKVERAFRRRPPLCWPTIPVDILKLVIEKSPQATLRNWCLVSKFCNSCATPTLYREVTLLDGDSYGMRPLTALLKSLVKGAGRHCRRLELSLYTGEDIYNSPSAAPTVNAMIFHHMVNTLCMSMYACR